MKRRAFIGLLGASALSMPFILSEHGLGSSRRNNRISSADKVPMRLDLPKDIKAVIAELGTKSRQVYMLGGSAIAAAGGVQTPYVNLLIDTTKFTALKQSLFEFGVEPISTAELPGNFARFVYQGTCYNVLNMKFDAYTLLSVTGQENGLILFAHNFLMYDLKKGVMLDPYEALKAKSADGKSYLIKPIQQPKTLLHGFEHCLAATFDCELLGLRRSPELNQIEERVLESTPTAEDSKEIMAKVLDYASDLLEVAGFPTVSRLMLSPVCVAAAKTDAEIDFVKVEGNLRRLQKQNSTVTSRDFMTVVHEELKKKVKGKGATRGLPEYLAANRDQFRRMQVLKVAIEEMPA